MNFQLDISIIHLVHKSSEISGSQPRSPVIPLFSGSPEKALQFAAAHVLQNDEHGFALGAASQKPHDVGMRIQVFHDAQLLREIQPLSFGGVLLQRLHRHDRGAGFAIDVQSLALPHLPEAALAEDVEDLRIIN